MIYHFLHYTLHPLNCSPSYSNIITSEIFTSLGCIGDFLGAGLQKILDNLYNVRKENPKYARIENLTIASIQDEIEATEYYIQIPRDRNSKFEPEIVPKYAKRLPLFNNQIISLYSRGMTTRDKAHLNKFTVLTFRLNLSADLQTWFMMMYGYGENVMKSTQLTLLIR